MEYDLIVTEPKFWEIYKNWCENRGEEPTVKGYVDWFERTYGD